MKKILLTITSVITLFILSSSAFANDLDLKTDSINQWVDRSWKTYVNDAWSWWAWWFFWWWKVWEAWYQWLLFTIARDLKNVFIAFAIIYLFILVLRLFFWQWSDDDLKKWRIWVLWTTIWIVLMQMSYTAVIAIYDKDIWSASAKTLTDAVIIPIIRLLEVTTSFIFMATAIMAFFRIVGWWGWDEWYKKWINSIINAIIWFVLVKISAKLVYSIYGQAECNETMLWTTQCKDTALSNPDLSETTKIIASTLKYLTWFIWVITIVLIIWAWFLMISSSWNEDKNKKAKSIIRFIFIWIILIAISVSLFNFMVWKDISWIIGSFK